VQCRDTTPTGPTEGRPGAFSCRYVFRVVCRKRKRRSAVHHRSSHNSYRGVTGPDGLHFSPGTPRHPGAPRHPGTPIAPGTPRPPGTPIAPGTPKHPGTPRQPGTPIAPGTPRPSPGSPGNRFPSLSNNFACETAGLPLPDQTELPAPSPPPTRPPGTGQPPGGGCQVVPDIIC